MKMFKTILFKNQEQVADERACRREGNYVVEYDERGHLKKSMELETCAKQVRLVTMTRASSESGMVTSESVEKAPTNSKEAISIREKFEKFRSSIQSVIDAEIAAGYGTAVEKAVKKKAVKKKATAKK